MSPEKVIRDLVELSCQGGKPADLTHRAEAAIKKMPRDQLERLETFVFVLGNLCNAELMDRISAQAAIASCRGATSLAM